jgi:hypothetical protein
MLMTRRSFKVGHPKMIATNTFTRRIALTGSRPELATISRHRARIPRELSAPAIGLRSSRTIGLALSAVSALLLVGCSKSHDLPGTGLLDLNDAAVNEFADAGRAERGGTGGRAGSSAAGRGGTGGRASSAAGRGGTGGRAGSSSAGRTGSGGRPGSAAGRGAAGSNSTGCNTCAAPGALAGLIQATSCCTASNTCGLTAPSVGIADCLPLDAPGTENATCPKVSIAGLLDLAGCCTADGTCGALDTFVGLGCAKVATDAATCTP